MKQIMKRGVSFLLVLVLMAAMKTPHPKKQVLLIGA